MKKIVNGCIAGFIGTVVISVLMIIKTKLAILPELNPILDNANLVGKSDMLVVGWLMHFFIGTVVWGIAFVVLISIWSSKPYWLRGMVFGILAWLAMMIGFMPIAGHGLFANESGMNVTIMTLVIHLIYGLVLGLTYKFLEEKNT